MEKKTRVERYQELRRNIERMTDYPFSDGTKEENAAKHVDALLRRQEEEQRHDLLRQQKKEAKRIRFQKAKEKGFLFKVGTVALVLVLFVLVLLVVVLYATGVIA